MRVTDYAEVARTETDRGDVVLRRRTTASAADVLELRANGALVADSLESSGETELAARALDATADPRRVVIGGLGLGHTLQRVLADTRVETATVVEIEDTLIGWMRDGTVPHGPALLADQRVTIINADIEMAIAEARSTYDLVLLRTDSGSHIPAGCAQILSPGGVLAVWSTDPAPELLAGMRAVFGAAEEQVHDVPLQERPERHYLYLAQGVASTA